MNSKKEKKQKERIFKIKNIAPYRVARIVLWVMIGFIFLRGVVEIIKPTDQKKVESTIDNFLKDFSEFKGENEEIMAFAQNFTKEYLTYEEKNEDNFKARIRPYVSDKLYNTQDLLEFKGWSECEYVAAYRKEQYSEHQYDVYVKAQVNYGDRIDNTTLRVPVYAGNGAYIVEGIPMVVEDSMLLANYSQTEYKGDPVTDAEVTSINVSLENFFKAYYEDTADVIEYYLAKDAKKTHFIGLYGRYTFDKINDLKCYHPEGQQDIIAIVSITVKDSDNGNTLQQEFNITITNYDGRYYLKDINTKTQNLN